MAIPLLEELHCAPLKKTNIVKWEKQSRGKVTGRALTTAETSSPVYSLIPKCFLFFRESVYLVLWGFGAEHRHLDYVGNFCLLFSAPPSRGLCTEPEQGKQPLIISVEMGVKQLLSQTQNA